MPATIWEPGQLVTVATTVSVNVKDLGAAGNNIVDDSLAFQTAINNLPALGGTIEVPPGTYLLNTTPNWGTKSVFWNISTAAVFTGAGTGQNKFPSMVTNGGQVAVGPFIQSQSRGPYTFSTPQAGGVAAFQVEMLQPADVITQSVAIYAGAQGSNPSQNANVWAANFLIKAMAGSGGTYTGLEQDVDCFSDAALVKGISINGIGTANPDVGLELIRSDTTKWITGIDIMNTITGIKVRNTTGLQMGFTVGEPTAQVSASIVAKQLSNGGDGIVLQRFTDAAPNGSVLRLIDAANSANLFNLDVNGNTTVKSLIIAGGAVSVAAGQLCFGTTTATAATAGAASALPATPDGYLLFFIGSATKRIPYYN